MSLLGAIILGQIWGLLGYTLRKKTKLSLVSISAFLTLLAALILPKIFEQGDLFALICTAVSYVIMSSTKHLYKLEEILLVSAICTLMVFFGKSILLGVGGRLGTFAALSVLIFTIPRAHKGLLTSKRR